MAIKQGPPKLELGQRIELEYSRGTVRFLGAVPPTKGEWIGVEWDTEERGKHSGEHNGTQYFTCKIPGTGSFTRPSPNIKVGQTLLEVLKERYVDEELTAEDLYLGETNVKVDVYDFDRIKKKNSQLHLMQVVGLANTNVSTAADFEETQKACPEIQDLDLSSTLIATWQDLADIVAPLSKLTVLRISRDRFHPLTVQPSFEYAFKNIRCLAMNRVNMLEPSLPNLEILQFGFNLLTELGKSDESTPVADQKIKGFAKLEDLHLEGNKLMDWNQILRLSRLPKLKSLDLSENRIANVIGPQDPEDFKHLESLRINDNDLKEWSSIDQLGHYTSLKSLWIQNNPIMTQTAEDTTADTSGKPDVRTITIARMAHITQLNGTEILTKNRIDAELYYLKNAALSTVGFEPAAIQAFHPRFEQLCELHGRPDTSDERRKATSDLLKDRLLNITFVTKDKVDGPVKTSVQRGVLGSMTVRNVKNLVQKLLRVPAMRQELLFMAEDPVYAGVMHKVFLKDDLRMLSHYDIEDGTEVIVLNKTK
ncbi:hypothetical protein BG015_011564 [Linnemannia schmuckeri]|uniref:Tubulin-folding cofactor E n=1 Tax=Linnemannia schmuckeri TaxID=64567 RepID=A0A9P5RUY5_9FUNG|nr:hypothetical protein BG015_011564 [Linnemannia schmuckeri]